MTKVNYKRFNEKHHYTNRKERLQFLHVHFKDLLKVSILDVGCDQKYLKTILNKNVEYVGVDISDMADIKLNLDFEKLYFDRNSFHTVVCLDVLEHLENIHSVMDDLINIASHYLIISLPNAWHETKKIFVLRENQDKYGLPPQKPRDRHRWFFNFKEAEDFIIEKTRDKAQTVNIYPYFNPTNKFAKFIGSFIFNRDKYLNLFSPTIWAVIEK